MAKVSKAEKQLGKAFDESNAADFKRILEENPGILSDMEGSENLLWHAALLKKLPIIKVLVELGADINQPNDDSDEDNPFFEPEGIILQAATLGDTKTVRWLLEKGAKINYVVNGDPRCMPLIAAVTSGHLDIVKLLVEHGADVHSTWQDLNAIEQAKELGLTKIRDYLLSLPKPKS